MDKMMKNHDDLKHRRASIEMTPDQFRALGHSLIDRLADFLGDLPTLPVTRGKSPGELRSLLHAERSLPENGADPNALLSAASELLIENSLFNGHPRFWGYITSSPAPLGVLGDLLASAINANVGGWKLSPMATELETQTVKWIAELLGYPSDCGGVIVSGGNMANFVGVLAARAAKADWDVRAVGLNGKPARQLRMYASGETHTWIHKAADLFGIGTDAIRWVATDKEHRMDVADLRRQIEEDKSRGDCPFLVVGTGGSVSTGLIDPLPEIAAVCREHDLWFHVDGAYGGFAAAVPGISEDLLALSQADSVAVDPHKWLYSPLEAGCALVRDAEVMRNAFSYHPPYYHFAEETTNYVDYSLQNSRGFKALKVWLTIQQVGRSGYAKMIGDDIRLAEALYDRLDEHPDFEAFTQSLSITTFRYVPAYLRERVGSPNAEEYLNDLNKEILVRLELGGEVFMSNAVIDDRFLLRTCIVNFRTSLEDIEALPDIVARYGREVDAELRKEHRKVS
jgi:glutamate/tyrosine decarboxylase-like PLP-dependent enzyme